MTRSLRHAVRTLNHAVRPLDEFLAPIPWSDASPVFILGTPRSGTTLTYQVLAQALRVTYLPRAVNLAPGLTHACFRLFANTLREAPASLQSNRGRTPGLFGPSEAIGFWTPWVDEKGPGSNRSAREETTLPLAVHQLQGHLKAPLLVKCIYLLRSVELLARVLPEARFIHVIRAPVPTIASLYRVQQKTAPAWWSVRPPGAERVSHLPLLDQCVWQYFAIDAMVRQSLATLDQRRSRVLVYEDLCRNPDNEVGRMRHWLASKGWEARENWLPPSLALSDKVDARLEQRIRESPEYRNE